GYDLSNLTLWMQNQITNAPSPSLTRTAPFLHKGAQKRYPVPIARGFVRWLQHSGETSVNDRKVKGSGQRTQYSS
ncbi:hypothetical protein AVEN_21212-1, partial [Araneus ventricosus]